ncbi:MAG: hypothetical protein DHS20C21_18080 [Gemmatimonadota bacterium]|nr:MAG: hypothetical protein DHS20C21_18080 [Gemmatimonadota bacterium]
MTEWVKLLTALAGAGGLGTVAVKSILSWRKSREQVRIRRVWASVVDTSNALRAAVNRCGCCRVLLIESTNGGGVPGPTNPAKVTVLYDATDGKTRSIAGKWVEVKPDHQYSELLRDLSLDDGVVHLVTEDLEPGDLKTLYQADEVEQSYVYRLAATEREMIYVSYNFPHNEELSPKQVDAIRETRLRIDQIVHENDETYRKAVL